jgi:phosphodiesterase/alkaline phosphatase D-like protein
MQDWRLRDGRIECWVSGAERNVVLLTREAAAKQGTLSMSVRIGRLEEDKAPLPQKGYVGFRTGVRGHFNDYRDTAVHGEGVSSGITADGRLFIGTPAANAPKVDPSQQNLQLRLTATPQGSNYTLKLEALDSTGKSLASIDRTNATANFLDGSFALVCSNGVDPIMPQRGGVLSPGGQNRRAEQRGGNMRFWFRDWNVSGTKVTEHPERAFGPILFSMHTLSRKVLKVTVQMAPLDTPNAEATLQTRSGNSWRTVATAKVDPLSRTAGFRVPNWNDSTDTPYRVQYAGDTFTGTVRRDPASKDKIVVGALTCCNDLGFPHQDISKNLTHFKPDILLFTGDQIYERVAGYGIQMEPIEQANLDYLRKWILFGWSFRHLMADIPTVCMPDDHDVYHGNIWGSAGKKAKVDPKDPSAAVNQNKAWQDSGGYKMPASWVNMVQRTQTSHLPDPYDPTTVLQDISVYYTSLLYGGVDFAIIEDRKWKSSPRTSIPWADIQNGWAQNPKYNGAKDGDVKGAEMLGPRQMQFLEKWAADWNGAWMKVGVSQTLWANLCTLPAPANNDDVTPKLPVLELGAHPAGEVCVADHDSNGWPQTPRTNAIRLLRKAAAFHIGGDQHLGSTVQYGIDEWNDGPFAVCTPAVSNIWPRRWYPPVEGRNRPAGSPKYCGEFVEGFGNKITVHAVANPHQTKVTHSALFDRAVGYGIITLDRATRKIEIANWYRHVDATAPGAKPCAGWPVTIHQLDNGLNRTRFQLPPQDNIRKDAVVQVVDDSNQEILYTVPAPADRFAPPVFKEGKYTVRLLAGGRTRDQRRGIQAIPRNI